MDQSFQIHLESLIGPAIYVNNCFVRRKKCKRPHAEMQQLPDGCQAFESDGWVQPKLEPLLPLEIREHAGRYDQHDAPHDEVAVLVAKLRNEFEVRPIDTRNKSKGDKNDREDRQELHDVIQFTAYRRMINVQLIRQNLTIAIGRFTRLVDVSLKFLEVHGHAFINEFGFQAIQRNDHFLGRLDTLSQKVQLSFVGVYLVNDRLFGIKQKLLFQGVNLFSEQRNYIDVVVNDDIKKGEHQVIRTAAPYSPFLFSDSFPDRLKHVTSTLLKRNEH
jgi:hypothetical protein